MNNSQSEEYVPLGWIMAAQAWAWTVSCVGGIGNLVTICAIAYQLYLGRVWRRRHGPAGRPVVALEGDTILLLHLSICDFLYCVVNLPITAITYNYSLGRTELEPSKVFCTGAALFRYVNALAEWTTLGLLTVQRCVDLGRSRGARFFRPRPTLLFIAGIWVVSVVLQLGAITRFGYDRTSHKCDMMSPHWRIYFFSLESLVPCGLMLTGCCSIICQIWRNTRKLRAAGMSPELAAQRFRSMVKSTALLLMLLFLFLACVIPICVYSVDSLLSKDKHISLGICIFMVYWIQYGVNFLVYAASNDNYRTAYKQFLMFLVDWVVGVERAICSKMGHGPEGNKADMTHPTSPRGPTVLPLGNSTTSLALLPLGACRKGSTELCIPISSAHHNGPHPCTLPCLHRLRSCHSLPHGHTDLDRRGGVLHPWPVWRSGSQSSRSSVLTLESTVQHDHETSTTVTSIKYPTSANTTTTPTTHNSSSTIPNTSSTTKDAEHSTTASNNTSSTTNATTTTTKISTTITSPTFTTTVITTPSTTIITTKTTPTSFITTISTDNMISGANATTAL